MGQGRQVVEGGGTVSHKEFLDLLGETAPVCTAEGDVIPSTVRCQGVELEGVIRDAPACLFDRVETAGRIGPGCGVIFL